MDLEERAVELIAVPAVVWEPIEPARSHLSYWLKHANRRFNQNFSRLLTECGIIASEWVALRELYGPQWRSPVALGQSIGMSKGGASKLVTRLVKKGLIEKRTADFDRRFRSIGLTAQGRDFVVRLASIEKRVDCQFFRRLGNTRSFRLTQWMKHVLDVGHQQRMDNWMSEQLEQHGIIRVDPDVLAKAAAEAKAKADELWSYFPASGRGSRLRRCPSLEHGGSARALLRWGLIARNALKRGSPRKGGALPPTSWIGGC